MIATRLLYGANKSVPVLSLGTTQLGRGQMWQLGDRRKNGPWRPTFDRENMRAVVQQAHQAGVCFFDTGNQIYGIAEEVLAQWIKTLPPNQRGEVMVATKVGYTYQTLPDGGTREAKSDFKPETLKRLFYGAGGSWPFFEPEPIDVLQLHSVPLDAVNDEEVTDFCQEMKERGQVRLIGATLACNREVSQVAE